MCDELPGVLLAGGDARCVELEYGCVEAVAAGAAHELGAEHGVETALPVSGAAGFEALFLSKPLFHFIDGGGEGVDAFAGGGCGADDGGRPERLPQGLKPPLFSKPDRHD